MGMLAATTTQQVRTTMTWRTLIRIDIQLPIEGLP